LFYFRSDKSWSKWYNRHTLCINIVLILISNNDTICWLTDCVISDRFIRTALESLISSLTNHLVHLFSLWLVSPYLSTIVHLYLSIIPFTRSEISQEISQYIQLFCINWMYVLIHHIGHYFITIWSRITALIHVELL